MTSYSFTSCAEDVWYVEMSDLFDVHERIDKATFIFWQTDRQIDGRTDRLPYVRLRQKQDTKQETKQETKQDKIKQDKIRTRFIRPTMRPHDDIMIVWWLHEIILDLLLTLFV